MIASLQQGGSGNEDLLARLGKAENALGLLPRAGGGNLCSQVTTRLIARSSGSASVTLSVSEAVRWWTTQNSLFCKMGFHPEIEKLRHIQNFVAHGQ